MSIIAAPEDGRRPPTESPHSQHPGFYYGTCPALATFALGDTRVMPLAESVRPAEYLWRVAAAGENVQFAITWGTRSTQRLNGLLSPLVLFLPGSFSLFAQLLDSDLPGVANATLTPATGGISSARTVHTGPVLLGPTVRSVTALSAGVSVTVNGVAMPLAQSASADVAAPSLLTAGTVLAEHAP